MLFRINVYDNVGDFLTELGTYASFPSACEAAADAFQNNLPCQVQVQSSLGQVWDMQFAGDEVVAVDVSYTEDPEDYYGRIHL